MKPKDLNDEQLLWLLQGIKVAYENGNGLNEAYNVSIKFIREKFLVVVEYIYGQSDNKEADPTLYEVKYFEDAKIFNIENCASFLDLCDKLNDTLNEITETLYDYGD